MAFDINKYFTTRGGNVEKSVEGLTEAANALLKAGRMSSNTSYQDWAQQALSMLSEGDPNAEIMINGEGTGQTMLDKAYEWIKGNMQSHRADKVWSGYDEQKADVQQNMVEAASNLANITDFSGNNPLTGKPFTDAEKQVFYDSEGYQQNAEKLANYQTLATQFGIEVDPNTLLTRTESGYIPTSEVITSLGSSATGNGRLGETVTVTQGTDGKWSIVGSSGKVYQSGFSDFATADATATFLQGGGSALNEITTTLPSNIDISGLTAQQISDLEAIYQSAQSNTSLITDPTITATTVTEAQVQDFLKTAQEELNPYYTQVFTRAGQEVEIGMKYLTDQRELALQTEKVNALAEQQNLLSSQAEKGTVFSGIRQEAEQQLLASQEGAATSSQLAFEKTVTEAGRSAEDYLGSEYLSTLELPELADAPVFTPSGDVKGSLEAEQTTAEETRASELEKQAALAEIDASDEENVATDEIAKLT